MISIDQIKKLREETGISISECKKALEESKGDLEEAKEILKRRGIDFAKNKSERETKEGVIETYVHQNKKIGVMVELDCESDFVAKSPDFQKLARELCLQIAAMGASEIPLPDQVWIKDEKKTIKELLGETVVKFGENIILKRFIRYEI